MKTHLIISIICLATHSILAQKKMVYINGYCSDSTINYVGVQRPESFWWSHPKNELLSGSEKTSNRFTLTFDLQKSSALYFNTIGLSAKIFVTPGDSIEFRIDKEMGKLKLRFSGKNAIHYNLFTELNEFFSDRESPVYNGDLHAYNELVDNWHARKKSFLTQYAAKYQMPEEITYLANADINYEKCFLLYMPFRSKKIEQSKLPHWYAKELDQFKFHDDRLLGSSMFLSALILKHVRCYTDNPWQSLDKIWINANKNFKGRIKEYLLTSIISIYANEQKDEYRAALIKAINESKTLVKDSLFAREISDSEQKYTTLNRPLPDSVINFTFLKEFGSDKRLTLGDVLRNQKGNALYLDFWASWCSPCRLDIKDSDNATKFLQSKGVTEIYISIDKDKKKWIQATIDDSTTANQFLLEGGGSSPLGRFLKIEYIPRYILMNRSQLLVDSDAPRPNESQLPELKRKVNEMSSAVFKYD
jgi:thiol-disulfide isomerase/thioredoxin